MNTRTFHDCHGIKVAANPEVFDEHDAPMPAVTVYLEPHPTGISLTASQAAHVAAAFSKAAVTVGEMEARQP